MKWLSNVRRWFVGERAPMAPPECTAPLPETAFPFEPHAEAQHRRLHLMSPVAAAAAERDWAAVATGALYEGEVLVTMRIRQALPDEYEQLGPDAPKAPTVITLASEGMGVVGSQRLLVDFTDALGLRDGVGIFRRFVIAGEFPDWTDTPAPAGLEIQ